MASRSTQCSRAMTSLPKRLKAISTWARKQTPKFWMASPVAATCGFVPESLPAKRAWNSRSRSSGAAATKARLTSWTKIHTGATWCARSSTKRAPRFASSRHETQHASRRPSYRARHPAQLHLIRSGAGHQNRAVIRAPRDAARRVRPPIGWQACQPVLKGSSMIRIRKLAEQAAETASRRDRKRGYFDGVNNLNPPNPDDLSSAYWQGYSPGQRDAFTMQDYYPDAHEARGF